MTDPPGPPSQPPSILIINPNSTPSMTASLTPLIQSLNLHQTTTRLLTAPAPSPPSINNPTDASLSASICLAHLTTTTPSPLTTHSAFLVACYSPHPLVPALRAHPAIASAQKPVLGIFEASILASLALLSAGQRFGIVTTGAVWGGVLAAGVADFLGAHERFAGVETTGLGAVELHSMPVETVSGRVGEATRRLVGREGVGVVCLGCAGMSGMEGVVREACVEVLGVERGGRVRIVDGVKAGVVWLDGVLRCGF